MLCVSRHTCASFVPINPITGNFSSCSRTGVDNYHMSDILDLSAIILPFIYLRSIWWGKVTLYHCCAVIRYKYVQTMYIKYIDISQPPSPLMQKITKNTFPESLNDIHYRNLQKYGRKLHGHFDKNLSPFSFHVVSKFC